MQTFSNETGVPLSVAVFLATDYYDHVPDAVSATALMRPLRQQILPARIPADSPERTIQVLSTVKSRIGTAIHDSVEKTWTQGHYKKAMAELGYPQKIIDRIVVNPEGAVAPGAIPIYMEKRSFRSIDGVTISGKFDLVAEGRLEDFKSTSTFTWVNDTKRDDYQIQGSIYRWLNPDIITEDIMAIQFFFTDWMAYRTREPGYPQRQVEQMLIPLLSLEDTEAYIRGKLRMFELYKNTAEEDIPFCTDKELWRREPVYKYYKNPAKRDRSTKNFTTAAEAYARLQEDGNVGVVIEVKGEVVACRYCPAFSVCTQKNAYIFNGSLNVN
jgi:hypothetical protein